MAYDAMMRVESSFEVVDGLVKLREHLVSLIDVEKGYVYVCDTERTRFYVFYQFSLGRWVVYASSYGVV